MCLFFFDVFKNDDIVIKVYSVDVLFIIFF